MNSTGEALSAALSQAEVRGDESGFRQFLDLLPAAIYTTDAEGTLTFANRAAAELAGRAPRPGVDKWCVSWRLYRPDGSPLALDECPMAVALKERRPVRDVEILAERPDGQRVPVMPFPTPLFDSDGKFAGAVNVLMDISRLKHAQREEARRADVQAALYQFTDRLYRAASMEETIEAALDAITGALKCPRAAILLMDDAGVARFVGWRGLSEGYRRAVEGHCPWKMGDRDPQPIFVPDIELADEPEPLKAVVRSEGIHALAFIPLTADGGVIGKFMTYDAASHIFSEDERAVAVTIARQLGFSIERRRGEEARRGAEEALAGREERLRAIFNSAAVGAAIFTPQGRCLQVNDAFGDITGYSRDELLTLDFKRLVHPEDHAGMQVLIDELVAGRRETFVAEARYLRKDGTQIWVQNSASATRDANGNPLHLVVLCQDVTERKQAEAQRDWLVAELNHRVKNTLATVISIARQSFGKEAPIDEQRRSFDGRIHALAKTHGRLAEANWSGVSIDEMLEGELAPYRRPDGANVKISGPSLTLGARTAVVLGMAFHELATNAAKYGALSAKSGLVSVSWTIETSPDRLHVSWIETGGPTVRLPTRSGFGRLMLERVLAADLEGAVRLEFLPQGVSCGLVVPLSRQPADH